VTQIDRLDSHAAMSPATIRDVSLTDIALVVDPDPAQQDALRRALSERYRDVLLAGDVQAAVEHLLQNDQIGLVIIDVDGMEQGLDLAGVAVLKMPTPLVIGTHTCMTGPDGFRLGKMGVKRLVAKPFTTDELLRALDEALVEEPPQVASWVAPFLGRVSLFEFENEVRRALVFQAVLATDESRSAAARLLRAPRPVIQRAAPPQTHRPRRRRR
jgi:DNA-binding response OmpR family regulator